MENHTLSSERHGSIAAVVHCLHFPNIKPHYDSHRGGIIFYSCSETSRLCVLPRRLGRLLLHNYDRRFRELRLAAPKRLLAFDVPRSGFLPWQHFHDAAGCNQYKSIHRTMAMQMRVLPSTNPHWEPRLRSMHHQVAITKSLILHSAPTARVC
jgi:hypothetical protein